MHDAVLHTVPLLHCLALLSGYLSPSVNFVYYIKFDSVSLAHERKVEKEKEKYISACETLAVAASAVARSSSSASRVSRAWSERGLRHVRARVSRALETSALARVQRVSRARKITIYM